MKELVILSGKGGTGKTSIVASFAALAGKSVLADCDVDAADLHLVLEPEILERHNFSGGSRAKIISEKCTGCSRCLQLCRFEAILPNDQTFKVDPIACEGCGVCKWFCPDDAIEFAPAINGEWFVSKTRHGTMVHAKLGVAEENSGKLVSVVRERSRELANEQNLDLTLVDGSPGIGCPVIASLAGASMALIVTEPTLSGMHDLTRVAQLVKHFKLPGAVCVNKWDLNPQVTSQIEKLTGELGFVCAGNIRYDQAVTEAQIRKQAVVEYQENGCAEDIRAVWEITSETLTKINGKKEA